MALVYSTVGDTLTIKPVKKKEKLPFIYRLIVEQGITYGETAEGLFELGQIPSGYLLERMNKYNEILFRNSALKPKQRKIHPLLKKIKMNKLFFFDLETTGVDYAKHGIHQISGKVVIDGITKEAFNLKVQPFPGAIYDDVALKIGNVTRADIEGYEPMRSVYARLIAILSRYVDKFQTSDKFFLAGFNNASFDNQFLRQWFIYNNDKYFGSWFWSSCIDVMILAAQQLLNERHTMVDFKLRTVAKQLGIAVDESRLHDAEYDIDLTHNIYQIITNAAKN